MAASGVYLDFQVLYGTIVTAAALLLGYLLFSKWKQRAATARGAALALRKRAAAKEEKSRILSIIQAYYDKNPAQAAKKTTILSLELVDLLKSTRSGDLSCEEVMHAYMSKALEVDASFNCVCEGFAEAFDTAREFDRLRKDDPKFVDDMPLFGLPLSVKECLRVQGHDATAGVAKFVFQPATDECRIITALRSAGCIPFVSSNVPQTMLTFDCSNPVYGETLNPIDKTRTCGGSSGGEAVLQATGGSLVGIGTDIGGSVRIPAHFCGTCSMKPTCGRLSSFGKVTSVPGQTGVPATAGYMSNTVDGCRALFEALQTDAQYKLDFNLPPIPVNQTELNSVKKVRLGYYVDDGFFKAVPSCARAVDEVVKAFKGSESIEFVPFSPPKVPELIALYYGLMSADGGRTIFSFLRGEVRDPIIKPLLALVKHPNWVRRLLHLVLKNFKSFERVALLLGVTGEKSVTRLWELQAERELFREEYIKSIQDQGLDGLLCPASTMTATKLRHASEMTAVACHTMAFNILDFPSGTVPVTTVTAEDDRKLVEEYAKKDLIGKRLVAATKGGVGLPVSVQVVTLPWQDEKCLNLLARVEAAFKK